MKKAILFIFFCIFLAPIFSQNNASTSIAMLNYLATETRIINNSRNNRLVLEETYTKLINNTNPSVVDVTTQDYLQTMLDILESFRMITLQRERLEYIFENQKAKAITQAMPNPLYLLGARDLNPLSLIATAAAMTMDSIFKYQNTIDSAEMDFMKSSWELDDSESASLHTSRSRAFGYMIDIARAYNLSMTDTLNEISIDNFVNYKMDDNLQRRRQTLENNRSLYAKYAPYWIVLSETYYELGMYQQCIDAVRQYESVYAPILRKDYELARILPKVIVAISNVYGTNATYINLTKSYLEKLVSNTTAADWALRYFAAQAYISMARVDNRRQNLTIAYELLVANVTYLSHEQEALLDKYVKPINETIPSGLSSKKVKEIKQVISTLKKERVHELPPLHDGLVVNFQTLLLLMQELNIQSQERNRIRQIVYKSFINPQMRYEYLGDEYDINNILVKEEGLIFKNVYFTLPIGYASDTTQIRSEIIDQNGNTIEPVMSWNGDTLRNNAKQINDIKAKINLGFKFSFKKDQKYEIIVYIRNKILNDEYLITAFHIRKERGGNNYNVIKIEKYVE
jgi:hypothetical protein